MIQILQTMPRCMHVWLGMINQLERLEFVETGSIASHHVGDDRKTLM